MKHFLNNSFFKLTPNAYLNLLMWVLPLLNFLSGVTFDLYTPSLPALATYYHSSEAVTKSTVGLTLLGFALGCFWVGILLDAFGRRRIILGGLFLYALVSVTAIFCQNIDQFIAVRFVQGLLIAVVSIGSRTIIMDYFTGPRFTIALLYTSLAYGLGIIVGPFAGGVLQYHFGWKANFIAYAAAGLFLCMVTALYVQESIQTRQAFFLKTLLKHYQMILRHKIGMATIVISATTQVILMVYATVGAFLVETTLSHTAIVYGNTALFVGGCYLAGTLSNRFFVKRFHLHHLSVVGLILAMIGLLSQGILVYIGVLNLFTIVIPIMIMVYSQGFVFPNLLSRTLKLFSAQAGMATASLTFLGMGLASLGVLLLSHIQVTQLNHLFYIFLVCVGIQGGVFLLFFKQDLP